MSEETPISLPFSLLPVSAPLPASFPSSGPGIRALQSDRYQRHDSAEQHERIDARHPASPAHAVHHIKENENDERILKFVKHKSSCGKTAGNGINA